MSVNPHQTRAQTKKKAMAELQSQDTVETQPQWATILLENFKALKADLSVKLDNQKEEQSSNFQSIDKKLSEQSQNFSNLESKFSNLESKFSALSDDVKTRIDVHSKKIEVLSSQLSSHIEECKTYNTKVDKKFAILEEKLLSRSVVENISKQIVNDCLSDAKNTMLHELKKGVSQQTADLKQDITGVTNEIELTRNKLVTFEARANKEFQIINKTMIDTVNKVNNLETARNFSELCSPVTDANDWEQRVEGIVNRKVDEKLLNSTSGDDKSVESEAFTHQLDKLWDELKKTRDELKSRSFNSDNGTNITSSENPLLPSGINLSKQLPKFVPNGDIHPQHFLKVFDRTLPTKWDDATKIDFTLCYLKGEAAEWGNNHADEFQSWNDFKTKFKDQYWSTSAQKRMKIELADPPYYSKKEGSIKHYLQKYLMKLKYLDCPMDEDFCASILVKKLPHFVQQLFWSKNCQSAKDYLDAAEGLDDLNKSRGEGNPRFNNNNDHHQRDRNEFVGEKRVNFCSTNQAQSNNYDKRKRGNSNNTNYSSRRKPYNSSKGYKRQSSTQTDASPIGTITIENSKN